jgi:hypothetical protein
MLHFINDYAKCFHNHSVINLLINDFTVTEVFFRAHAERMMDEQKTKGKVKRFMYCNYRYPDNCPHTGVYFKAMHIHLQLFFRSLNCIANVRAKSVCYSGISNLFFSVSQMN